MLTVAVVMVPLICHQLDVGVLKGITWCILGCMPPVSAQLELPVKL